jgi:hypothetical protein
MAIIAMLAMIAATTSPRCETFSDMNESEALTEGATREKFGGRGRILRLKSVHLQVLVAISASST